MYSMRGIKSKNHNLGIYKTNKISLSCFDDKRYILRNGIETFAYEHKDIKMIDLDTITNEKKKHNEKMAIYFGSSVHNFDNWWFWIRENKHIT